jgi:hypothetical protein
MVALRNWNLKRLLFFHLCAAECADDQEMLLKALGIIGKVGVS